MPQFHLDYGSPEGAREFAKLDSFTQGYIEAMFFFTDASDPDDGDLQDATFAELAPDTLAQIVRECADFQTANAALLESVQGRYEKAPYDAERAGNDYWFTRNGHGTGFWDRGLGDAGDKLAAAARYSSRNLYRGDDGLVYVQ